MKLVKLDPETNDVLGKLVQFEIHSEPKLCLERHEIAVNFPPTITGQFIRNVFSVQSVVLYWIQLVECSARHSVLYILVLTFIYQKSRLHQNDRWYGLLCNVHRKDFEFQIYRLDFALDVFAGDASYQNVFTITNTKMYIYVYVAANQNE